MKDIFISSLSERLSSWVEAFPESIVVNSIQALENQEFDANQAGVIFWLHKSEATVAWLPTNQDQQIWLTDTIKAVLTHYQSAKIVVLANMPSQAESMHALRLGAMGYSHAYTEAAVLKEMKAVINHGGLWLGQDILQRLIEASTKLTGSQQEYIDRLLAKLTSREQEVALEAAKGLSNKEIARILSITERTVKAHLAHIFERLGAKDRLQLALMLNSNAKA